VYGLLIDLFLSDWLQVLLARAGHPHEFTPLRTSGMASLLVPTTLSELLTELSADQLQEVMLEAMAAARRGDADWRMVCVVQSDDGQAQVMFSIEWGSCRTKSRFEFAVRSRKELC
jgi:hypothetical protein